MDSGFRAACFLSGIEKVDRYCFLVVDDDVEPVVSEPPDRW
jgi:hypothetical protein